MSDVDDNLQAAVVAAVLARVREDRARGLEPSLAAYQAAFPGHEETVARELAALPATEPAPDARVDVGAAPPPRRYVERYEDRGELARGGMGEIRRVWDADLRRQLVMKRLRTDADGSSGSGSTAVGRFLEEAQITAQLDHPGIVAVHDLGLDGDGRVFFTMSLIRGRDFKDILELVREGAEDWTTTRALHVLLRVCDAVAFAHSKGVVHRDLKPANVRVGRFGEVYVMDWGLARVLGEDDRVDIRLAPEDAPPSSIRTARKEIESSGEDAPLLTMDGDVVGTPAYMAPEQARGLVDRVGPRADVYAIGAMLYHLLARCVPYVPPGSRVSPRTVLSRVLDGPPQSIREVAPAAPAEVVAICETAMAREPDDRYEDVTALADDLRAFLELRVVRAYETGAVAELRKWVARNKPVALASIAAVIALVAGLVFSVAQARRADAAAQRAEADFGTAFRAVDELLSRLGETGLEHVPGASPVRRALLDKAVAMLAELESRRDDPELRQELAFASGRVGKLAHALADGDAADAAHGKAIAILEDLRARDPHGAELTEHLAWARCHRAHYRSMHGHPKEAEPELRECVATLQRLAADGRLMPQPASRLAHALWCLAKNLNLQGRAADALPLLDDAIRRDRQHLDRHPSAVAKLELASRLHELGVMLMALQRTGAAIPLWTAAAAHVREAIADDPKSRHRALLGTIYLNLANCSAQATDADHRRAIDLWQEVAEDYPTVPSHRGSLGASLHNFAMLVGKRGERERAKRILEEAIEHQRRAHEASPDTTWFRVNLANHYSQLSWTLVQLKRPLEVPAVLEKYVALGSFRNPINGRRRYPGRVAAGHLGACCKLLEQDRELSAERRTALREQWTRRAIELLQVAVDAGFTDVGALRKGWGYEPFRDHPEFQRLVERLEAAKDDGK